MDSVVNLTDLWRAVKKYWHMLVLCGLVAALLVFVFFSFFVDPKYTAEVDFVGNNGFTNDIRGTGDVISYSDYVASVSIVDTYVGILTKGTSYLEEAGKMLDPPVSLAEMKKIVSIDRDDNAAIFQIKVTTYDPKLSSDICTALSKTVKPFLEEKMPGSIVNVINEKIEDGVMTYPAKFYYAFIGGVIGLAIAFSVMFFMVYFDNSVKREEDFKQKFDYNFLGEIPNIRLKNKARNGEAVNESRIFQFNETFKTIRTSLIYALAAHDKNIITISSPSANEGKSTVAYNLANAVSQSGARVLLIDADMRCPSLNKLFKIMCKDGLATVLSRQKTFDEAVVREVRPGLDVLFSGINPPNPSELLGSAAMSDLLKNVSGDYDYVLIDTAPVNMVSDALAFIKNTSGMIVVARYKKTTYADLSKAFDSVKNFDGNILGVVLNDVEKTKKDYKTDNKYYVSRKMKQK